MKPRLIPSRHRSNPIINFFSHKNGCHMWCETYLEEKHALTLEFDNSVRSYTSQPGSLLINGKRYTPDFLVDYHSGKAEWHEVKHSGVIKRTPDFKKTFRLNRIGLLEAFKIKLKLFTEEHLENFNIGVLKELYRFKAVDVCWFEQLKGVPVNLHRKLIHFNP
ncbi:TnsA endonuclease N-terminal domain-containing protein [Thalassotalea mangrovi]|nr:TnsA endonuclease N-terminal domain-containing protein [Thalassotalea mangrovi]